MTTHARRSTDRNSGSMRPRARDNGDSVMRIIDSHFHWWPRSVFEALAKRKDLPRAVPHGRDGYLFLGPSGREEKYMAAWSEWFDIDEQLAHMDALGHEVDVVCSIGPFSVAFS